MLFSYRLQSMKLERNTCTSMSPRFWLAYLPTASNILAWRSFPKSWSILLERIMPSWRFVLKICSTKWVSKGNGASPIGMVNQTLVFTFELDFLNEFRYLACIPLFVLSLMRWECTAWTKKCQIPCFSHPECSWVWIISPLCQGMSSISSTTSSLCPSNSGW